MSVVFFCNICQVFFLNVQAQTKNNETFLDKEDVQESNPKCVYSDPG